MFTGGVAADRRATKAGAQVLDVDEDRDRTHGSEASGAGGSRKPVVRDEGGPDSPAANDKLRSARLLERNDEDLSGLVLSCARHRAPSRADGARRGVARSCRPQLRSATDARGCAVTAWPVR
jgi:hypothetical protein